MADRSASPRPADAGYLEARRLGYAAARIADHARGSCILLERAAQEADATSRASSSTTPAPRTATRSR